MLYSHLQSLGYDKEVILKAGLVKLKEGGEPYDVFRDRIIFPLSDQNGRVIAFSGRAFSKETEPKYLNSPDTALFTKSEVLYGLDKAKESIRKQDYAVLVEGQMDFLMLYQDGVKNVVATSGTALSPDHLRSIKRLTEELILSFDNDEAGQKAAERSIDLAAANDFTVKLLELLGLAGSATTQQKY